MMFNIDLKVKLVILQSQCAVILLKKKSQIAMLYSTISGADMDHFTFKSGITILQILRFRM